MNSSSYGIIPMAIMVLAVLGIMAALQKAVPDGPLQTAPLEGPCISSPVH